MSKNRILKIGKMATNRSLTDFQYSSWKDENSEEKIHKIKMTIQEYAEKNGRKVGTGNLKFYFDLDEIQLLAQDILNMRMSIWTKQEDGYQLEITKGTKNEARKLRIKYETGKRRFIFHLQSSKEVVKKGDIYIMNYQKKEAIETKMNYASFEDTRKAMLNINEFISNLTSKAFQEGKFNLRWELSEYETEKKN